MNQHHTTRIIILISAVVLVMATIYVLRQWQVSIPPTPIHAPSASSTPHASPVYTPTPQEQAVLIIPLHYAPQIEKTTHAQNVAKLVKKAPELDITACVPKPTVYEVSLNGSFAIKNNDAIPHTLRYMSFQIMVPSHGSTTIKTSKLFKTTGDYGYGCDNPFAKHGVLVVR